MWQVRRGQVSGRAALDAGTVAFTPSSLSPAWWQEARNYATFFQAIAGTGAAPASDGDVIGWIPDLSGNAVTLIAGANNATRPTLTGTATKPAITMTAANSTIIWNSTSINSYNAGAASWFFAIKSNSPGVSTFVATEAGSTGTNDPIYSLCRVNTATATTLSGSIVNTTPTTLLNNSQALQTNGFDGSNHVLGIIDNGTTVTPYKDGVAGSPFTYTARTGTVTCNRFALGGLRRTASSSFWNGDIYGGVCVNRVLTSQEISDLTTYLTGLY